MRARLEVLRLWLLLRLILGLMLGLMLLRLVLRRLMLMMLVMLIVLIVLMMLLRLMLLLARIELLRLARRIWLAHLRLVVAAVVVALIGNIATHATAWLLLKVRLTLAKLFLRGGDQAKIMLGVLIIILGSDRIPGALRVTG